MALEMSQYVHRTRTREGSPRFSITLSPAALSLAALGMLLILGWCFYMGFMIGRGQNPEEHLQRLAAVLQSGDKAEQPAAAQKGAAVKAPATEGAAAPAAEQGAGQAPAAQGQVPGYPVFQTQGAGKQAQPQAQGQARSQQAQAQPAAKQADKAQAGQPTFTFVYRMATVFSREDARREQERYETKGFSTSIRQSGKSWGLYHTFKGTDRDCEIFLSDVKRAGLGQPSRVSRKKN